MGKKRTLTEIAEEVMLAGGTDAEALAAVRRELRGKGSIKTIQNIRVYLRADKPRGARVRTNSEVERDRARQKPESRANSPRIAPKDQRGLAIGGEIGDRIRELAPLPLTADEIVEIIHLEFEGATTKAHHVSSVRSSLRKADLDIPTDIVAKSRQAKLRKLGKDPTPDLTKARRSA